MGFFQEGEAFLRGWEEVTVGGIFLSGAGQSNFPSCAALFHNFPQSQSSWTCPTCREGRSKSNIIL
jgi:hypothetical protein